MFQLTQLMDMCFFKPNQNFYLIKSLTFFHVIIVPCLVQALLVGSLYTRTKKCRINLTVVNLSITAKFTCWRHIFLRTSVKYQLMFVCLSDWVRIVIRHLPKETVPFNLSRAPTRKEKNTRLCKQLIQNTGLINFPL